MPILPPPGARGPLPPETPVALVNGLMLPVATYEAIADYVYLGRRPSDFLQAVLCNDLLGACQHADRLDAVYLRDTTLFVYNHCPRMCCGSPQRVDEWLGRCGEHFRRIRS